MATITDNAELQNMLSDWFEWMDYEKWVDKWQPDNNTDVIGRLKEHSIWVENSAVQFTPTFFINGHKLPGKYGLDDISGLLPQLVEILKNETVK